MAKFLADVVLDAALTYVSTNATQMYLCIGQPANYAGIAAAAVTGAVIPTFDALTDGDVSGRKVRSQQKTGVAVTANGTAAHVALATGSVLLAVTTITPQVVTSGNTCTIGVFDVELVDVTP